MYLHSTVYYHGLLQGHTLGYRYIICEQDINPFDDILEHWIYAFKALLSKHNKHAQNGLQQIVQSRGFKAISTFVGKAFENIVDQVRINLHLDITNCTIDSHVSIPEDVIQVVNDMGKQEVTLDGIQFCNIHHKSILLDLFVDNDLYDDNIYVSDAEQKITKKPGIDPKKIEFNIDVNNNKMDDLYNKGEIHLNDGLADDKNIDIEDSLKKKSPSSLLQ